MGVFDGQRITHILCNNQQMKKHMRVKHSLTAAHDLGKSVSKLPITFMVGMILKNATK